MAPSKSKGKTIESTTLKVANSLKLRHILCEKHSKHLEALEKLNDGQSFDQIASQYSEDKARSGGSLGFLTRAGMMGAFQEVCFSIPISTCAKPDFRIIKTKHGYHIVMVEDRK